eukprot:6204251-Pleurochrysis_carterae.AAC.1
MTASADASAISKMACDYARRVEGFTQAVLAFWHCQAEAELKAWKTAACIVFCITDVHFSSLHPSAYLHC